MFFTLYYAIIDNSHFSQYMNNLTISNRINYNRTNINRNIINHTRECVIYDYVERFNSRDYNCDNNISSDNWLNIVQNSNDFFHGFSYLIKDILTLIDNNLPCHTFFFRSLSNIQISHFYNELSSLDIPFEKIHYFDNNNLCCVDIKIKTFNIWSIPDIRAPEPNFPSFSNYTISYILDTRINIFNQFYNNLDLYTDLPNHYILVSLKNYIIFKRIYAEAHNSATINNSINNSINSTNYTIRNELADLIFDIKDNITDSIYKELLEKIAKIQV